MLNSSQKSFLFQVKSKVLSFHMTQKNNSEGLPWNGREVGDTIDDIFISELASRGQMCWDCKDGAATTVMATYNRGNDKG